MTSWCGQKVPCNERKWHVHIKPIHTTVCLGSKAVTVPSKVSRICWENIRISFALLISVKVWHDVEEDRGSHWKLKVVDLLTLNYFS